MQRRHILKGVGGMGAVLAILPGIERVTAQNISIEIVETNDPIQAGDFLDVVVAVENASGGDVRPDLEFFVGDERLTTSTATIEAGETREFDFGHLTYPVTSDVEFTVSVETEVDGEVVRDERTVAVTGIDELDTERLSPPPEIVVEPGTEILFEIESDLLGDHGGRTEWYLTDGYAGRSDGPWNWAYFEAQGVDHWRQSFDEEGTYDVIAAVVGDDENATARWTVEVSTDADAEPATAPSIESVSPDPGPLELSSEASVDLEATVAAPGGNLDRAVWWLAHADVVLGVSDLEGGEDTATLTAEELCHGCPIVLWVIDDRGAVTSEELWTPQLTYDGETRVSAVEAHDPVEAGEFLEVTAEVENTDDAEITTDVELVVGETVVDTQSVTIGPDATESVSLGYDTYPVTTDVTFPVKVRTESDRETTTVDVVTELGSTEISILETSDPVGAGEFLEVEAEVTNVDDEPVEEDVYLVAGDRVDSESVSLEPGESTVLTLGYETYPVTVDVEFPVEVVATGSRDSEYVQVFADGPPDVSLAIVETNDPVEAGEFLEVTIELENVGDGAADETIDLVVGGQVVDSVSGTIDPGETVAATLGYETYPVQRDVTFAVRVENDALSDERTVEVFGIDEDDDEADDDDDEEDDDDDDEEAGPVTVSIDSTNDPVEGGEELQVIANAANNGTAETTETVVLVVGGDEVDSSDVVLDGESTQIVELSYMTYPVEQDVTFDVTVETGDDSDSTTVDVSGTGEGEDDGDEEGDDDGEGEGEVEDDDADDAEAEDGDEDVADDGSDPETDEGTDDDTSDDTTADQANDGASDDIDDAGNGDQPADDDTDEGDSDDGSADDAGE